MARHFLGLDWAPLHIPLERRLQTTAVCIYVFLFTICGLVCWATLFYITVWVRFGWVFTAAYGIYRYLDESPRRGGWNIRWLKHWSIWRHFVNYFPIRVVKTAELPGAHNYLLGIHPHGIIGMGCFGGIGTEGAGFSRLFPSVQHHVCTLEQNFRPPFQREALLSFGTIDASKEGIRHVLGRAGGGHAVVLMVGGAQEALDAHRGQCRLTMARRKGFVKLALTTGAQLVPVFAFGENDVYDQVENPEGSLLRRLQMLYKRCTGYTPPLFHGRGVFNYTLGLLPYRRPITVVVGAPIPVERVAEPNGEQIDSLHARYKSELAALFEAHKKDCGLSDDDHIEFA